MTEPMIFSNNESIALYVRIKTLIKSLLTFCLRTQDNIGCSHLDVKTDILHDRFIKITIII